MSKAEEKLRARNKELREENRLLKEKIRLADWNIPYSVEYFYLLAKYYQEFRDEYLNDENVERRSYHENMELAHSRSIRELEYDDYISPNPLGINIDDIVLEEFTSLDSDDMTDDAKKQWRTVELFRNIRKMPDYEISSLGIQICSAKERAIRAEKRKNYIKEDEGDSKKIESKKSFLQLLFG